MTFCTQNIAPSPHSCHAPARRHQVKNLSASCTLTPFPHFPMKHTLLFFLLGLVILCVASEANATVVLSNLGLPDNGVPLAVTNTSDTNVVTEFSAYIGSSFVVGPVSGNTWNLDSVTLRMGPGTLGTTGAFSVAIYADASDANTASKPGTRLGVLTGNAAPPHGWRLCLHRYAGQHSTDCCKQVLAGR